MVRQSHQPLCHSYILAGLAAFAILPVALELSVETTYPVNEGTSAGFLWVATQAFSFAIVSCMEALEGLCIIFDPISFKYFYKMSLAVN